MYSLFYIGYTSGSGKIFRFRAIPSMASLSEARSAMAFLLTGPVRENTSIVEVTPDGKQILHPRA